MIKLVIFDVWDTLLSLEGMHELLASKLSEHLGLDSLKVLSLLKSVHSEVKNLRINKTPANKVLEESRKRLCEKLGLGVDYFMMIHEELGRDAKEGKLGYLIIDGARDVLSYVKSKRLKTAVLGNVLFWDSSITTSILETSGMSQFIDKLFFSDTLGHQKPEFEAFMTVLKHFNLKPDEAIHVGDNTREDFGGALVAGLKAVLIKNLREEIIKTEEFAIIPNIRYLIPLIDEWSPSL
ncbi:MAG: HAD family hydrolase [Zestosphaera sp.]